MLIAVMAAATIVEKLISRGFVLSKIYNSWWFVALWAVFATSALIYIVQKKLYKKTAVFLVHTAFFVILCGAFTTFLTAKRGYMHLRQNEIHNYYIDETTQQRQPLPFNVKLLLFEIEYHPNSSKPADYHSFLMIDNEVCKVSMNKIHIQNCYRLYQMEYDNDEMGATLLVNYDFWGILITYSGYFLLLISALWLIFQKIGGKMSAIIGTITLGVWFFISQINPMMPILRSPMLAMHVSVIMVSYFLLLLITILSIIGLVYKTRRHIYLLTYRLLYPAVFLLAIGIFIGAVWANISWGRYWGWDSKETWALITLLVYAIPFHKKTFPKIQEPKFFYKYLTIAFFSVLMTFLGVSFILGGIHSYL
jgi:ABC-type transport system involved in cytochrome c biogenesis permease subunit